MCLAWVLAFSLTTAVHAQDLSSSSKLPDIPTKPSATNLQPRKVPAETFSCTRYYSYKGEKMDCDSNVRRDGEKLRPLFTLTPEAFSELMIYQSNRRSLKTAAYVSTGGIVLGGAGWLVSRLFFSPGGNPTDLGIVIRNLATAGGLGVLIGSAIYSLALTRANEQHLGRAVELYNAGNPGQPVELQFSTGLVF